MSSKVRVLVVDDSAFFRSRITHALEETGEIQVVGQAANGSEALRLTGQLRPDLVTMDVEMPVMDGISAVKRIMAEHPTNIIMFSALTRDGAQATLDALDAGAVDFLPKHSTQAANEPRPNARILRERVLAVAARQQTIKRPITRSPAKRVAAAAFGAARPSVELVLVGASTGGPVAIQQVLASFPRDYGVPVLVAVHMPAAFTPTFAERLNSLCALSVKEAESGDALRAGQVLIAPGGKQTLVEGRLGALHVSIQEVAGELYRPSVDLCFGSAARVLGRAVLAVVLTGMGADGSLGAGALKRAGSQVWSQDRASCVVYGMPQAVEKAGLSDRVMPLKEIGPTLVEAV